MTSELFRREAIEARRERLAGEVTLTTPPSALALTGLLAAIVFAAGLGLSFGSYARKETVAGWVTTDKGLARVAATGPAVISSVHVAEGAFVAKGDALVTLTQETGLSSGGGALEATLAALAREEKTIAERMSLARERFAAARAEFETQIAQRRAETLTLRAQGALQTERVATSQALLNRLKELESEGAAAGLEIDRQRDAAINERQRANDIARALLAAEGELAKIEAALARSPAEEKAALAEFAGAAAGLEGRSPETIMDSRGR